MLFLTCLPLNIYRIITFLAMLGFALIFVFVLPSNITGLSLGALSVKNWIELGIVVGVLAVITIIVHIIRYVLLSRHERRKINVN